MTKFELATEHKKALTKVTEAGEKVNTIYRELRKLIKELPVDKSTREFNESNMIHSMVNDIVSKLYILKDECDAVGDYLDTVNEVEWDEE